MWLSMWLKTLAFLKKAWEALKKLPRWAFLLLLLLFSTCWYLAKKVAVEKKKVEIRRKAQDLEIKKNDELIEVRGAHKDEGDKIIEKFNEERKDLEEEEKELNDSIAEGPVGIARAWASYLEKNK